MSALYAIFQETEVKESIGKVVPGCYAVSKRSDRHSATEFLQGVGNPDGTIDASRVIISPVIYFVAGGKDAIALIRKRLKIAPTKQTPSVDMSLPNLWEALLMRDMLPGKILGEVIVTLPEREGYAAVAFWAAEDTPEESRRVIEAVVRWGEAALFNYIDGESN